MPIDDIENAPRTYDSPTIAVGLADLRSLLEERDVLRAQVTALQRDATRVAEASLARQVRAFHLKFGHPVATTPAVPEEAQVRFRLKLIAEEFFELVDAALAVADGADVGARLFVYPKDFKRAREEVAHLIENANVQVDLPEFADALADLDYVVEGTRAVFGIHGAPIAAEVHRANMDKDAVQVAEADSAKRGERIKPVKPAGWRAPDVEGVLREQGWR